MKEQLESTINTSEENIEKFLYVVRGYGLESSV